MIFCDIYQWSLKMDFGNFYETKKSEVFKKFKEYKVIVEAQTWHKLKCFRFDNGGEFMFGQLINFVLKMEF